MRAGVVKAGGAWRGKGIVGSCFLGVIALESEKGGGRSGGKGRYSKVPSHQMSKPDPHLNQLANNLWRWLVHSLTHSTRI